MWSHKFSIHVCVNLAHVTTAKKMNEIKPESFQKQDQTLTKGTQIATPILKEYMGNFIGKDSGFWAFVSKQWERKDKL